MMSEFSDRPLVAGTLTGVRSFKVDSLGRLTGVSHQEVWKPGLNRATCKASSSALTVLGFSAAMRRLTISSSFSVPTYSVDPIVGVPTESTPEPVSLVKAPKHRVAQLNCGCGYWAYFDKGSNPHHADRQIIGIVEGHGNVTVGSRGFRAERAKIVALVDPKAAPPDGRPFDRLAAKFYTAGGPLAGIGAVLTAAGLALSLTLGTSVAWPFTFLGLIAVAGVALTYLSFRSIDVHDQFDDRDMADERFGLVRRNYPDVPVYSSLRSALAAHPLTPPPPPEVPSPETDPEFWTRGASS
jgi:hypothetical protein